MYLYILSLLYGFYSIFFDSSFRHVVSWSLSVGQSSEGLGLSAVSSYFRNDTFPPLSSFPLPGELTFLSS
jgi:hypothetical protein